jgi:hypothetical protein
LQGASHALAGWHGHVPVEGVKELALICHYVDGWFSSTRAQTSGARLVSP